MPSRFKDKRLEEMLSCCIYRYHEPAAADMKVRRGTSKWLGLELASWKTLKINTQEKVKLCRYDLKYGGYDTQESYGGVAWV